MNIIGNIAALLVVLIIVFFEVRDGINEIFRKNKEKTMNLKEAANNAMHNLSMQEDAKFTVQEVFDGIMQAAPAIDKAWQLALDNDALWEQRAKHHGALKTWWLRWQLRRKA